MTECYAAPLEGVTYCVWREAHRRVFGGADRYYTPFLAPSNSMRFQTKELRELSGGETDLVPQLLANRSDYFLWAAKELFDMGFREVNFNFGCPSGTVVAKHKGSGALRSPEELDALLDAVFSGLPDGMSLSVKTRIGMNDCAEWENLLTVYEKYPICALTVHPRLQCELYKGKAHRALFLKTLSETSLPLIYNGDITEYTDEAFGWGCGVMAGRGLASDPALFRKAKGGAPANREELIAFHEIVLDGYAGYLPGEQPLLHRMKEFWQYFSASFLVPEPVMKSLQKSKTLADYRSAAERVLRGCPLKP